MRESRLYLQFFKDNQLYFIALPLVLGSGLFFYQQQKPPTFHQSILLQMDYNEDNFERRAVLADQAVTITRSDQLQDKLGLSKEDRVLVYKSGPQLITIDSGGVNKDLVAKDRQTVTTSLQSAFPVTQVGNIVEYYQKTSEFIYAGIGIGAGLVLALIFSLIRTYFQKF
jgi:transglutaminase/protease-like cytokinesis protein 3